MTQSGSIAGLPPSTSANLSDILAADQVNPASSTGFSTRGLLVSQLVASAGGQINTRLSAITSTFSGTINAIHTNGYFAVGDGGGALYRRFGSVAPAHGAAFQSADGAWWELAERGPLDAMMFGIIGDGVSDNWLALKTMRDYMRTYPRRWQITFAPGVYLYSKNYWAKGINDLTIHASGVTFQCTSTDPFDVNQSVFIGNKGVFEPWGYENYSTATNYGFLINSADAGGGSITTSTHADAGNFATGNRVLIYGYSTQDSGFPPNSRYFEWAEVVSANASTGVITLVSPLRNSYDSRWHDFLSQGAPRILNLTRTDFTQNARLVIYGGYFRKNPFNTDDGDFFLTEGYDYVELNGVKFDHLGPTISQRIVVNDCIVLECEIDKIISSIEFNGGRLVAVVEATGAEEVILRGNIVLEGVIGFECQRLIVDGAHFSGVGFQAAPNVLTLSNAWPMVVADIRHGRFTVQSSSFTGLVGAGVRTSFTIASVSSNTKVLVSTPAETDFETIYRSLRVGFTYQLANGSKRVRITKIYDADASHVAIEGEFTNIPLAAEVYNGSSLQRLNVGEIIQDGPFAPLPIVPTFGYNQQYQRIDARDQSSETLLISWQDLIQPASGGNNQFLNISIRGWIRRVVINVSKTYSGPDGSCVLHMATPAFTEYIQLDAKTAGIREITAWGSQGSVGADNLRPLSFGGVYLDQISFYVTGASQYPTYSDPVQLPKFTIHIETQKE